MEIPVEVLDHIFGFLKSHPRSLLACSNAHPILAQIVERHLYYHIVIIHSTLYYHLDLDDRSGYKFDFSHMTRLLSDTPRIADYVRILELSVEFYSNGFLENIAPILSSFHAIQCFKLTFHTNVLEMPRRFKTALEDCLRLPTLQEVHIANIRRFPISILNDMPNITRLSLSRSLERSICSDGSFPQLKSLSLSRFDLDSLPFSFTWAKHMKLQSFAFDYSNEEIVERFLRICSDTLENLDFGMGALYETTYECQRRVVSKRWQRRPKLDLSILPCLQHLTVHVEVYLDVDKNSISSLPASVQICKTASQLQYLTFDIRIDSYHASLSDIYWSPLVDLATLSASIVHIDLYIRFTKGGFSRADVVSALAEIQVLKELIEQGVLVIHVDEVAPEFGFVIPSAGAWRMLG